MANKSFIPEMINDFNAYKKGNKFIGITSEVTLAEIAAMTSTISGAGIAGEIESVILGKFQSMKQTIGFRMLDDDIFSLANPTTTQEIVLRASEQSTIKSTGEINMKGMRIIFRGRPTSFNPGTMTKGGQMNASITLELFYMKIEIDGKTKLEIDKLNEKYTINGKDMLSKIRKLC